MDSTKQAKKPIRLAARKGHGIHTAAHDVCLERAARHASSHPCATSVHRLEYNCRTSGPKSCVNCTTACLEPGVVQSRFFHATRFINDDSACAQVITTILSLRDAWDGAKF